MVKQTGIHWDLVGVTPQENRKKQKEGDSLCGPNGRGIWEDPWEDQQALKESLKHFTEVAPR